MLQIQMMMMAAEAADELTGIGRLEAIAGIAVAVLGLPYSYLLIAKTRRETALKELEIEEKRRALGISTSSDSGTATDVAVGNIAVSPTLQSILLRFVILELLSRFWFALAGPAAAIGSTFASSLLLFGVLDDFLVTGISLIPTLLFWVIAAPLAISIFVDANRLLGLSWSDFSIFTSRHTNRSVIAFIVALTAITALLLIAVATTLF